GAGTQLLDVDVAALLPGRDRAQRGGGDRRVGRDRVGLQWHHDRATGVQRRPFLPRDPAQRLHAGGQADRAEERRRRDPYTGQLRRRGPAVGEVPVDDVRVGELVTQEAEPGDLDGEAVRVGNHLEDLDLQHVARL